MDFNERNKQNLFGVKEIEKLTEKWDLPVEKVVEILSDIEHIKNFYKWVNADDFLSRFKEYLKQ